MRGGGRYYEQYRKSRQGGEQTAATVKITIFTALLVLACVLRFSDYPALKTMRAAVANVLQTNGDYKGAVEVLGRAFSGDTDEDENAIAVFGRKIFGFDTAEQSDAQQSEPEPTEPLPTEPPVQSGAESSGAQPDSTKAGELSGFLLAPAMLEYVCEAMLPAPAASSSLVSYGLEHSELDTTPDEPFEIPSPDSVDDTVYEIAFEYAVPASGRVSSDFGYRTLQASGETVFHHGADIAVNTGTKVTSFAAGTVSKTGYNSVYGNYVRIEHADGFESMYAHLSKITVKTGKKVKLGEKIGESGATGNVTGAHLHFELRKDGNIIDPTDYLDLE